MSQTYCLRCGEPVSTSDSTPAAVVEDRFNHRQEDPQARFVTVAHGEEVRLGDTKVGPFAVGERVAIYEPGTKTETPTFIKGFVILGEQGILAETTDGEVHYLEHLGPMHDGGGRS